jgi:threonine synthase
MNYVTHLESAIDGSRLSAHQVQTVHRDRPLWVRYNLSAVRAALDRDTLRERAAGLWRYRELLPLPLEQEPVSLGEGMSPLLPCRRLCKELGLAQLFVKDESQLPTGSFKARGMTVAVSMARQLGLARLAIPSAGNAGGALAAYAARAGMEAFVFMPVDTPLVNQVEAHLAGARVFLVNGLISDCGKIVRETSSRMGWFDLSTLREPYRLEGKKTMGLELAEQMNWDLPDTILYPTGGGTGLIGMWKAFLEMRELGWLRGSKLPRLIACQSNGCAPIVRAFDSGERFAQPIAKARTKASGLRVPSALGDFMILDAVRSSDGLAATGDEEHIDEWICSVFGSEGIGICPEAAICFDVLARLRRSGHIGADEHVVVFNTGAIQKYPEIMPLHLPVIDRSRPLDFDLFSAR